MTTSIAYLGPEGTFSYEAALSYFGEDATLISTMRIPAIYKLVEERRADYGIVPAENTSGGIIADTLDSFIDSPLKIYDEIKISINQNLIAQIPHNAIQRIYSHPQSLMQCSHYLQTHFREAQLIEANSNTEAVLLAKKDAHGAAIGPKMSASRYQMNVLEEAINDNKNNITRFFIIATDFSNVYKSRSLILFSVLNKAGALLEVLQTLQKFNCNMLHIASRPSQLQNWEYVFIIEYENPLDKMINDTMLEEIKTKTDFLNYLGTY